MVRTHNQNKRYSLMKMRIRATDLAEPCALSWAHLMLEVRALMQKHIRYLLLNYYADGTHYISQHRSNGHSIGSTFPTLYTMGIPTNELYTHGIDRNPSLKYTRISLTFRHVPHLCTVEKTYNLNVQRFCLYNRRENI